MWKASNVKIIISSLMNGQWAQFSPCHAGLRQSCCCCPMRGRTGEVFSLKNQIFALCWKNSISPTFEGSLFSFFIEAYNTMNDIWYRCEGPSLPAFPLLIHSYEMAKITKKQRFIETHASLLETWRKNDRWNIQKIVIQIHWVKLPVIFRDCGFL